MVRRGCGARYLPFTKTIHAQSSCICGEKPCRDVRFDHCGACLSVRTPAGCSGQPAKPASQPSAARRAPSLRRLRAADKSAPRRDSRHITQIQILASERAHRPADEDAITTTWSPPDPWLCCVCQCRLCCERRLNDSKISRL